MKIVDMCEKHVRTRMDDPKIWEGWREDAKAGIDCVQWFMFPSLEEPKAGMITSPLKDAVVKVEWLVAFETGAGHGGRALAALW